jgi:hypothetical protein
MPATTKMPSATPRSIHATRPGVRGGEANSRKASR